MATDSTQICNFALGRIGNAFISNINDVDTQEAILCKLHFQQTMDEELRFYVWNSAEAQLQLVKEAAPSKQPILDYKFIYKLPNDPFCLRVLDVNDSLERWRVSGRNILTDIDSDVETVNLRFTKRITDILEMDSLLVKVIYTQLALKISWPLTQSEKIYNNILQEYTRLIGPLAKFIDSTENRDDHTQQSGWENSRGGGRTWHHDR